MKFNKLPFIALLSIWFLNPFFSDQALLRAETIQDTLQTEGQKSKEINEVIKDVRKQIDKRYYKTAFEKLQSFDPHNKMPDIVLLKIEIALNYYSSTGKLQFFAFEDLHKLKEPIETVRETKEQYVMTPFYIDRILDTLLKSYPENGALYNKLGEYYFLVHQMFQGDWVLKDWEVLERASQHFGKAIELKQAIPMSYYVKGYVHLVKQEYEEAIPYLSQTIFLDSNYGSAFYNLAYAHYHMNNLPAALINAETAIRKQESHYAKSEASRMSGLICDLMNDQTRAFYFFKQAIDLNNDNLEAIVAITENCLKNNRPELVEYTKEFALFNPLDFDLLSNLVELFKEYNRQLDLAVMLKQFAPEMKSDPIASGNLYYCVGELYSTKNVEEALQAYQMSKKYYLEKYPSNNVMIALIEQKIAVLKM
jgi:tetratricopeptide (TPR) repeat protein